MKTEHRLTASGITCELIRHGSDTKVHGFINLTNPSKIEIFTPLSERDGLILLVRSNKIETRIYLPPGTTLSTLITAIDSAMRTDRARIEER